MFNSIYVTNSSCNLIQEADIEESAIPHLTLKAEIS